MPGIRIALDALSDRAAALPRISIEPPEDFLGHNTGGAMRSGVVYGNASMIDGMIVRMRRPPDPPLRWWAPETPLPTC